MKSLKFVNEIPAKTTASFKKFPGRGRDNIQLAGAGIWSLAWIKIPDLSNSRDPGRILVYAG